MHADFTANNSEDSELTRMTFSERKYRQTFSKSTNITVQLEQCEFVGVPHATA
jgi:hypothetical protein